MRVFVISLPNESVRRANAARQLDAAGVPFEFFDAIRGEAVAVRCPFDCYDEKEFVLNTGRHISSAEKGCFASHRALWERSAALNEPIVVMEDDFELRDVFACAVHFAASIIDETGFVRLQKDLCARRHPVAACDGFVVSRYTKPPHGSMCYCIAPRVAKHFLSLTRAMDAPVDVFIKKFWEHRQPLYALTPYPVVSSPLGDVSTIARRPKPSKPMTVAARRFLKKTRWHCRRIAFNARQRFGAADMRLGSIAEQELQTPSTPARG